MRDVARGTILLSTCLPTNLLTTCLHVAQLLMRDHWRDRGMLGKERVGHKERSREHTVRDPKHGGHKHGHKSQKSLASLTWSHN